MRVSRLADADKKIRRAAMARPVRNRALKPSENMRLGTFEGADVGFSRRRKYPMSSTARSTGRGFPPAGGVRARKAYITVHLRMRLAW